MIDTHVHTARFSKDSILQVDILYAQLEQNQACLCEHMDYGSYVKEDKKFDTAQYFKDYEPYRDRILLGIEIGMDPTYKNDIFPLNQQPFDYILGSLHGYRGENMYNNPDLYRQDKKSFYKAYFSYVNECLDTFGFIDAFAHFDYVSRYATYKEPVLIYEEFYEEYQSLFQKLLEKNCLLEVNTKQIASMKNLIAVLKGYHEAGGMYVTLGSDAHQIEDVFKSFSMIAPIIKEIGLEIVYFEKRKMKKGAI